MQRTLCVILLALAILVVVALLQPRIHESFASVIDSCARASASHTDRCTMNQVCAAAQIMNKHNRVHKAGAQYRPVECVVPEQCKMHQGILKTRTPTMAKFSKKANAQVSAVHNRLHQSKIRHCQYGKKTDAVKVDHNQALAQLRSMPVVSRASFKQEGVGVITPTEQYQKLLADNNRQQREIDGLRRQMSR